MRLPRITRRSLVVAAPLAAILVLVGGAAFRTLETQTVGGYPEGILWALSLMTTVGFVGGLPHTVLGKLIAATLMLFGFILLSMTTAAIASLFITEEQAPEEQREHEFEAEILRELRALHARLDELEERAG
jgi:voltage-gated potassium channel